MQARLFLSRFGRRPLLTAWQEKWTAWLQSWYTMVMDTIINFLDRFSDLLLVITILTLVGFTAWTIAAQAWAQRIPPGSGDEESSSDALLDEAVQQNVKQKEPPPLTDDQLKTVDKTVRLSAVLSTFKRCNSLYRTAQALGLSWREVQAVLGANGFRVYKYTPPEIKQRIRRTLANGFLTHTDIAKKYDVSPKVVELQSRNMRRAKKGGES